jgi:hypothetical protein
MRYYVLNSPAGVEIARLSGGNAAYFETTTGRWVPDPLLAVEVRVGDDWRQVEAHELPRGVADDVGEDPRGRRSRSPHRGRHSRK